jgi:hypothetical protein
MNKFTYWFKRLFSRTYTATKCGHRTKKIGRVFAEGGTESAIVEMPLKKDGTIEYCVDCLGKMTVRCAWCSTPIYVGSPITLYTSTSKDFKIPEHAVVYKESPLQLVGCLMMDCADTGADCCGFWAVGKNGKGEVIRFPSIFEQLIMSPNTSAIYVGDIQDMKQMMNPQLIQKEGHKETIH